MQPPVLRDLLDASASDERRRLLDLLLDDATRLEMDETVAAIEQVLASDRRGLESARWQHVAPVLQPTISRLAAIGRLVEGMASAPVQERPLLLWRMRGHLARLRASDESGAEQWSTVEGSLYRTHDAELARILSLALDALESIAGTAAWSSRSVDDTIQALAHPVEARETLLELLGAVGDLVGEISGTSPLSRGDGMAVHARRRLEVGRAALAARAWLAATVAWDRPFGRDVQVMAASARALDGIRALFGRLTRLAVLEAILERVAPERLTSVDDLAELVLAIVPDPSLCSAEDVAGAGSDLVALVPSVARFITQLPPASADQLRSRISAVETVAELGLVKLVDDSVAAHSAPPNATSSIRVELAELVALIQPAEATDDAAKAPILVKTYQGDEFRAARIRPVAVTSNPRLPSIHVRLHLHISR